MKTKCRVNIVIPNWNGMKWLPECLQALFAQDFLEFDVTVIDNGSEDGSIDWMIQEYPQINLIRNESNRGFAVAVNQGIAATQAEYVVLLNTDTKPRKNWLRLLVEYMDKADANLGAVASKMLLYSNESLIENAGDILSWYGETLKRGYGENANGGGATTVLPPTPAPGLSGENVTSQKDATGREDFPTYNKKCKDVGWETFPTEKKKSKEVGWETFPTENVIEKSRESGFARYEKTTALPPTLAPDVTGENGFTEDIEVFSVCAGAALYRRSCLDAVGGFDERFFAYLEDVDFGLRARILGYRSEYVASAQILHHGHASGLKKASYVRLVARNRILLFFKNIPANLLWRNVHRLLYGQWYFMLVYRHPLAYLRGVIEALILLPRSRCECKALWERSKLTPDALEKLIIATKDIKPIRTALLDILKKLARL